MSEQDRIHFIRQLEFCPIGTRIKFKDEKPAYKVRARSGRYLVCTRPHNPLRTVIYTIVDLVEWVRGTENLVFGMGAESDEDCQQMIDRLEDRPAKTGQLRTEVSHRNRIDLEIESVTLPPVSDGSDGASPSHLDETQPEGRR